MVLNNVEDQPSCQRTAGLNPALASCCVLCVQQAPDSLAPQAFITAFTAPQETVDWLIANVSSGVCARSNMFCIKV